MANKKMLPREKKLKEKVEELDRLLTDAREEIRQHEYMRTRTLGHIRAQDSLISNMREEISDLQDFKQFARFALPHLQEKREVMAMNEASRREDGQEH